MNTRIDQAFARLRAEKKKAFIAYITAGDGGLSETLEQVRTLEQAGVDLVELGLPFSDPLADGRVNQESASRALAAHTTYQGVMETIASIRDESDIPLLCYSYLNPLLRKGFSKAMRQAANAGLDGFLILDMPAEEAVQYRQHMDKAGLNNIVLVTPTTTEERMARIVDKATGFVYCVSRTGVTGAQKKVESGADDVLRRARKATDLPLALGFGISSPDQARKAARLADGVVVGSAIVQRFHDEGQSAAARKRVGRWVAEMVRAVKGDA